MTTLVRRAAPVVVAMLVAACGSTADPGSGGVAVRSEDAALAPGSANDTTRATASTTTAPSSGAVGTPNRPGTGAGSSEGPSATPGASGGAPNHDPIEIGFVRTGVSNAAAFGASVGNTVTEAAILDALVASYNDHGGIAGRPITPVYADTDTASSSWDADFAAACAKFTEDHDVAAVLGYVFTYLEAFEACLSDHGVPHLSTSPNIPDAETVAQFPLWLAIATPLIERRSVAKIDGGVAADVLTSDSKIGVLIDPCPGTKEAWEGVTEPYLEAKGLEVVSVFEVGCAHGSGDAGAEAGRAGNLVLQFRSEGVDTVMFMSVSEGPPLFIFSNAAESQAYRPTYVVSSLAGTAVLGDQLPPMQARNVHGFGWLPTLDVKPSELPPLTASAQRCITMLEQEGIELSAPADYAYAFNACDALFLYEQALGATGGNADGGSVVGAIESLGTSYESAINLEGRSVYGPGRHDAPAVARYFAWQDECSCFRYRDLDVPIG